MSTTKTTAKKTSGAKKASTTKKAPAAKAIAKKEPTAAPAKQQAGPKPPPIPITAIPFQLHYLDGDNVEQVGGSDLAYRATTCIAVTMTAPIARRYLHLVQTEQDNAFVFYMVADRDALAGAAQIRLPQAGSFLRAMVQGTFHVFGADKRLSRDDIHNHIRGHEPPPQNAKPPYT